MNLHKFIFSTLLLVASSAMFTACDDDDNQPSYPAKLEIVTSTDTKFGGQGGTLQLLVNSNVDYRITSDTDWIIWENGRSARPLNGRITFIIAPFDKAVDLTPRTGTITLTADGVEPATLTVEQVPGELFRFEITGVSATQISAKGGDLEIKVESNIDYTVQVSDKSWINQTSGTDGKYIFAISENTVKEPRTGVITFATSGLGDFKVEFTQDPYVEAKGIATATQLTEFAAAVNAGTPLDQWTDETGAIVLLADIDMSGASWTPIGNLTSPTITNGAPTLGSGNPFSGVFDGKGHTIRNLAMSTDAAQCLGLFGACSDATIRNLNIDSSCTLQIANEELKGGSVYAFVAGLAINSTFENITVAGHVLESIIYKGSTKYIACISGIAGHISSCTLKNCNFTGSFDRVRSNVYDNSLGSAVAGIVGFARGSASAPSIFENCTSSGYVYGLVHRAGGILAGTTGNFIMRGCANTGIVHSSVAEALSAGWASGLRMGGLLGLNTNTKNTNVATIENCTNSGTVLCEGDDKTIAGALLGNPRCHTLTNGINSGTLITTGNCIAGLIIGQLQCADKPTIVSAKCGGKIATAFTGSGTGITPVNPIEITAANYFDYATGAITGTNSNIWTTSNVTFLAQ